MCQYYLKWAFFPSLAIITNFYLIFIISSTEILWSLAIYFYLTMKWLFQWFGLCFISKKGHSRSRIRVLGKRIYFWKVLVESKLNGVYHCRPNWGQRSKWSPKFSEINIFWELYSNCPLIYFLNSISFICLFFLLRLK